MVARDVGKLLLGISSDHYQIYQGNIINYILKKHKGKLHEYMQRFLGATSYYLQFIDYINKIWQYTVQY